MSKDEKIMSKYTEKNLKKHAVFHWEQDMQKFIVYPLSWGFFYVEKWKIANTSRPFWIIYWNPVPGAKITRDGVEFEPEKDKIYLFPPHTRFTGNAYKPFIQFAVHFHAESPFDRVVNNMLEFSAENISALIMKLSGENSKLQNTVLLQQIILNVLSQIPMEAFQPQKKTVLDLRIREILQYIEKNPGARHTVESLSERVKMSVNNFHRKFVEGTDTTPKQYLLNMRLEYAKRLLLETVLTIDEIASEAGFMDRYHFSKAFKKHFLYPPVIFRKKILCSYKPEIVPS